jgi:hypothetical protein
MVTKWPSSCFWVHQEREVVSAKPSSETAKTWIPTTFGRGNRDSTAESARALRQWPLRSALDITHTNTSLSGGTTIVYNESKTLEVLYQEI